MTTRRVVAEIGSCGGDFALAIDTAQAAIDAGAWRVKGQGYTADTLTTKGAPSYGYDSITEPKTQYEAFGNALSADEWWKVADAVQDRFFLSVFDESWCMDYPYTFIKIASADITYKGLIQVAAATGAHVIMSTGAATVAEINTALGWIPDTQPTLMVCTLAYPTPPEDANVRRVGLMKVSHPDTGYSDHTRGVQAADLAFEYGATLVEKHFTITPDQGGDHDFAIGPDELRQLVNGDVSIPNRQRLLGDSTIGPVPVEAPARQYARRSIHARVDIPTGTTITRDMLHAVRPTGGLGPWLLDDPDGPVGTTAIRDYPAGTPI